MKLNTASQAISLARKLEEDAARFYEELAGRDQANAAVLLTFAKENKRFISDIQRAYYGVITDAIEGCFAFDLDEDKYVISSKAPESSGLKQAIAIEETIIKFYGDAAEQSRSLMCDVPRVFNLVAKKRGQRLAKLKSMGA